MEEILRTNDPILISYVEALFKGADVDYVVFDNNMSIMEGSIGIFPRRILVDHDHWQRASRLLDEVDISHGPPPK